jgi:hypothetical protein
MSVDNTVLNVAETASLGIHAHPVIRLESIIIFLTK